MNIEMENGKVAFAEDLSHLDEGIRDLSAMLNNHEEGTLWIGVDEAGDIVGLNIGPDIKGMVRSRIRELVRPRVVPMISELTSDDGRGYLKISIAGFDIPYSFDGRYFLRSGTSTIPADPDMVSAMVMSRPLDPLRVQQSDRQDLTFDSLSVMLDVRGLPCGSNLLRTIGLIDDHGRYNLAAYLVSDQNSLRIQVIRFHGRDRSAVSTRTDFGGRSLILSTRAVLGHVSGYMLTNVDLSKGERREEHLFDFESFREAWINACVHNAWHTLIPPAVLIFDDRIEVVSYGRIPFPLSTEDFFAGDSRPINTSLFQLFLRTGLTEHSGHGVPTIVRHYGREAFHISDNGVTVRIPFAFVPDYVKAERESDIKLSGLDPAHSRLLVYLESHPEAKLTDAAEKLGMSYSSVKKAVALLKSEGRLRNDGTNRNSRWTVL